MTARVHPGETPASWIMKGFLDFVTGTSAAKLLRTMFVFKVVPVLSQINFYEIIVAIYLELI